MPESNEAIQDRWGHVKRTHEQHDGAPNTQMRKCEHQEE